MFEINVSNLISRTFTGAWESFHLTLSVMGGSHWTHGLQLTPAAGVCCKCNGTIKWHNTYIYNKTIV